MSNDAQQVEFSKNTFYRDQYRRVVKLLVFFSMTAIGLAAVLFYMTMRPGQPKYYATTTSGLVISLHSLSEPVITKKYLVQWASLATRQVMNIEFASYQSNLKDAKAYFTPSGWNAFNKALKSSGLLNAVTGKKLDMSAVVSGTPVILNSGDYNGRYTWRIQMPVLVTFTSASAVQHHKMIVTMNIQRVPVLSAPKGIEISNFEASSVVS